MLFLSGLKSGSGDSTLVFGYTWDNHTDLMNVELTAPLLHLVMLLRDLGVQTDKFHDHVTIITKKADSLLAIMQTKGQKQLLTLHLA